ncbi:Uncharacterised protein [Vibrio cholerae]|nr:Uncharacterised protein [Vibrio cholerae]
MACFEGFDLFQCSFCKLANHIADALFKQFGIVTSLSL